MSDLLGYSHEETAEKVWDELVKRAPAVIGANESWSRGARALVRSRRDKHPGSGSWSRLAG